MGRLNYASGGVCVCVNPIRSGLFQTSPGRGGYHPHPENLNRKLHGEPTKFGMCKDNLLRNNRAKFVVKGYCS